MKDFSVLFFALGVGLIIFSLTMKTSISSASDFLGRSGEVNNIGLLQDQQNYLMLGIGMFIVGAILFGIGDLSIKMKNIKELIQSFCGQEDDNNSSNNDDGEEFRYCQDCGKLNPVEFKNCRFCNAELQPIKK